MKEDTILDSLPPGTGMAAELIVAVDSLGNVSILKDRYGNVDSVSVQVERKTVTRATYSTRSDTSMDLASEAEVAQVRREEEPPDVRAALARACQSRLTVEISGQKVNGERYYDRRVRALAIIERETGFRYKTEYLVCVDQMSNAERSFKLGGIEKVVVV